MGKKGKTKFSKWLEQLQQESWQLELIISGFTIFLLLGAYEPIQSLDFQIQLLRREDNFYEILKVPYGILVGAWYILVFNLLLHIALRGLWISTIGLRYVSDDIDFDALNFSPKFDKHLRKRIGSFDAYIERLEKLCSVIFAFTFLIVFILMSVGLALGSLLISALITDWIHNKVGNAVVFFVLFVFFLLIGGLIYILDFITLGWIKRRKIARFYYPFYRFYSLITLSFIYRPIYYNLIDNPFGRRVGLLVIPYLIALIVASSLTVRSHAFLPTYRSEQSLNNFYYEDTSTQNKLSSRASIPSKIIKDNFLLLYLPYNPNEDDNVIQAICPDLKPAKTGTGFKGIFLNTADDNRENMNADSALLCNAQRHQVYINDSLLSNIKYRFYEHPIRQNIGLLTILDIKYLPRGEHAIRINTKFSNYGPIAKTNPFTISESANIPFWKE